MDLALLTAALLWVLCSTTLQNRISPNQPEEIKVSGEAGVLWTTSFRCVEYGERGAPREERQSAAGTGIRGRPRLRLLLETKEEKQLPSSAAREATLRGWMVTGGWEGEKAAHPQIHRRRKRQRQQKEINRLEDCSAAARR